MGIKILGESKCNGGQPVVFIFTQPSAAPCWSSGVHGVELNLENVEAMMSFRFKMCEHVWFLLLM